MPLRTEVGLSPADFVLDGDPAPLPKKGRGLGRLVTIDMGRKLEPPIFGPCLLWPNDCIYQDITWYRGRP